MLIFIKERGAFSSQNMHMMWSDEGKLIVLPEVSNSHGGAPRTME